jgi:hypothetical protein
MPERVRLIGNTTTRSGKIVSLWEVSCLTCGRKRNVKRADHAKSHASKECKFCSNRKNNPQGNHRGMRISFLDKYKLQGQSRNKKWGLTHDQLADIADEQGRVCALTGLDLVFSGDFSEITASLDRIDNGKDYVPSNVQWVHKELNMMRGSLTVDRFKELCAYVASHNKVRW